MNAYDCLFRSSLVLLVALAATLPASPASAAEDHRTAEAQLAFGVKMAQRGLWQEALFRFKQADRLEPGNSRTLNNMAVSYEALGLFDKALEVYQDAVKADPGNADLRQNYGRFVDFYRNFRPDPGEGDDADAATASAADPVSDEAGS